MSWYNPFTWSSATGGVDLDAEAERTRALNEKKAAMDAEAYRRGIWTAEDLRFVEQQRQSDAMAWNPDRYDAAVTAAAAEGAAEGLANMQATVQDVATTAVKWSFKGVFGFIPWPVWIGAAIYAAWHFGAFKNLVKR